MEFRVLGPIEVLKDGQALALGPRKQRSLLALLLVHANRVVTTDHILEALWGDDASGKENALWVHVSKLRGVLEPERTSGSHSVLVTRDHGYSLVVPEGGLDAARFAQDVGAGQAMVKSDPGQAVSILRRALDSWRGSAYEDFTFESFTQQEIARLEALRIHALEERIEADLRRGQAGQLIGELEALHQDQPLRERPVGQLMRAMYQAGRQAEALRFFDRFRRYLGEELGTGPSPELCRLEEQILLHDPAVRSAAQPASATPQTRANPFKGLRAFREADASDFFGRDGVVAEVVRRISEGEALIGLVGASGSGKSSIVRAGLVPAVRKGAVANPDDWLFAQMVPGVHPFAELEAALLRSSLDAPESLSDQLRSSDDLLGMLRAVMRVLPEESSRMLLVIDQFEELFTLTESEAVRNRFLDELVTALEDPRARLVVALTLRADFYDRPLLHARFGSLLGSHIVNVVPMPPDELEQAAVVPAERQQVVFEPSLLATLLRDVVGQPGALPLFQYTLTELFDRHADGVLTIDSYEAIGGVNGALSRRADDLYSSLTPDQRTAARQIFLRLVSIADSNEWSRRRVPASEILSIGADAVTIQAVIERFGRHRLLTFDRDQVTNAPTVEVAHEALLSEWPRLRDWIESAREDIQRHVALTAAMHEWVEAGHDADFLLTGARLRRYGAWAETSTMRLTQNQLAFLQAGREIERHAVAAEQARVAAEQRVERSARRRLWALAALGFAIVFVAITGYLLTRPEGPHIALVFEGRRDASDYSDLIALGWDRAVRGLRFQGEEVVSLVSAEDEMRSLAESGADLVIGAGSDMAPALRGAALDQPQAAFALVDSVVDLPNVVSVVFAEQEGAFLAGAVAASMSRTRTVGFVGGTAIPVIERFRAGFEAGAQYVDPDITVVATFVTKEKDDFIRAFGRPDLGEAAGLALNDANADVVFHAASSSGWGVIAAAKERSATTGRHHWVIGVDVDQHNVASAELQPFILTSVVKKIDAALLSVVENEIADRTELGTTAVLGLAEDGLSLARTGGYIEHLDDLVQMLTEQVINGEIAVPSEPTGPTLPPPEIDYDASVRIRYDGTTCAYEGPTEFLSKNGLEMDLWNLGGSDATMGLVRIADGATIEGLRDSQASPDLASGAVDTLPSQIRDQTDAPPLDPGTFAAVCVADSPRYAEVVIVR